jgi:hypothetical protein
LHLDLHELATFTMPDWPANGFAGILKCAKRCSSAVAEVVVGNMHSVKRIKAVRILRIITFSRESFGSFLPARRPAALREYNTPSTLPIFQTFTGAGSQLKHPADIRNPVGTNALRYQQGNGKTAVPSGHSERFDDFDVQEL